MKTKTGTVLLTAALLHLVSCGDDGSTSDSDAGTGDVDADTDVDAGADADTDGDTDTDGDADADTDTDADGDTDGSFSITSPAFENGDTLPIQYACDGQNGGVSPPLSWTGAPSGTAEFVLLVTTVSVDGLKWNWVRYGIPADASTLPEGGGGIGTDGLTSDGPERRYYPPCPHGPGAKTYFFTLYALSEAPAFPVPDDQVNGTIVTDAISGITLDRCEITATYTEKDAGPP